MILIMDGSDIFRTSITLFLLRFEDIIVSCYYYCRKKVLE